MYILKRLWEISNSHKNVVFRFSSLQCTINKSFLDGCHLRGRMLSPEENNLIRQWLYLQEALIVLWSKWMYKCNQQYHEINSWVVYFLHLFIIGIGQPAVNPGNVWIWLRFVERVACKEWQRTSKENQSENKNN